MVHVTLNDLYAKVNVKVIFVPIDS